MAPEALIARGERAKQLLAEPIITEAFATLEKDVMEEWARSPIRDKEGQNELLLMVKTARKFKAIFETLMATGEMAAHNLKTPRLTRTLERFGIHD